MKYTLDTMIYFVMRGMLYGVVLGGWSTTIMLPIIGTFFGLMWGAGIGTACGLLCGALVSVIQAYTFHPDVDLPIYRRRLSIVVGIFIGIAAPLMLILTSNGILWGSFAGDFPFYFLPSLIAVIFWGGLSAAYVGHGYPLWLAQRTMNLDDSSESQRIFRDIFIALLRNGLRITLTLGGIAGFVIQLAGYFVEVRPRDNSIGLAILNGIAGIGGGLIVTSIVMLMIILGTAALIVFLKRVLFFNDALPSTSHFEQIFLTNAAIIFTTVICFWPIFALSNRTAIAGIFPVFFCALFMGFHVYRALSPETDKAKRKENEAVLSEGI